MTFPQVLTVPGRPPPPNPRKDRSGDMCAICRRPVEHHDNDELTQEVEACARLSLARRHAGLPLRSHEIWCIRQTEQKAAA